MDWPEDASLAYIGWYIDSSLCGVVAEPEVQAVVMGRPVACLGDGQLDRYYADWKGSILWVECCASEKGMLGVWNGAMEFLTSQNVRLTSVAWIRGRNRNRVHHFPLNRVSSLLR